MAVAGQMSACVGWSVESLLPTVCASMSQVMCRSVAVKSAAAGAALLPRWHIPAQPHSSSCEHLISSSGGQGLHALPPKQLFHAEVCCHLQWEAMNNKSTAKCRSNGGFEHGQGNAAAACGSSCSSAALPCPSAPHKLAACHLQHLGRHVHSPPSIHNSQSDRNCWSDPNCC